jgi:hypothetical protein
MYLKGGGKENECVSKEEERRMYVFERRRVKYIFMKGGGEESMYVLMEKKRSICVGEWKKRRGVVCGYRGKEGE